MIREILYETIAYKIIRKVYFKYVFSLNVNLSVEIRIRALKNKIIQTGRNVVIGDRVKLSGRIKIGDMTYLSSGNTDISAETALISIGRYCSIAANCFIRTSSHFLDRVTTSPRVYSEILNDKQNCFTRGNVVIEDDVWIGANVTILGGVTIGKGAIIGAGSVVIKDVESYCVYAGNPAKKIKNRFNQISLKEIQQVDWIKYNNEQIKNNKELFYRLYK